MNCDAKLSTWRPLSWKEAPQSPTREFILPCPDCGKESWIPTTPIHAKLIGHKPDGGLVFEPATFLPPSNWLPTEAACPHCGFAITSVSWEEGR
jgi:predicted RNA-binding Zn-ribbon protein involved in translation (DUF1610 family)